MDCFSREDDINIKLNDIFKNRFEINLFDIQFTGNIDDNLIGGKFNFRARDLIYLLYDIEEKFNIKIPEEDIDNNKFNTIGNIIKIINKELEAKKAEAN